MKNSFVIRVLQFVLMSLLFTGMVLAQSVKTYIPPQAFQYFPTIKEELNSYFPDIPAYNYIPGLIEHESCISLKHKRCFSSTSELKSERELGVGLGQITKTYNADKTIRFDALTDMKDRHKDELADVNWDNVKQMPKYQIRMIVLMTKDNYRALYNVKDNIQRLKMSDAAYNGGLGGVNKERRACGLAKDCNPETWDNNVELYCLKSKKPIYGDRSACDINRHHVSDVFDNRMPKYKQYF